MSSAKPRRCLEDAADELYCAPPSTFTELRREKVREARTAGDREAAENISKLRKPTTGAFLVNLLAHHERSRLERLIALGADLRGAQRALAGAEIRRLSREVRDETGRLARRAVELAGEVGIAVGASVRAEVQASLEAAVADGGAADEVLSGRLTSSLGYSGFGLGGESPVAPQRATKRRRIDSLRATASRGRPGGDPRTSDDELAGELSEAEAALSVLKDEVAAAERHLAELRRKREAAAARVRRARGRRTAR